MTEHHEQLILKYLQGTISASEQQELNAWMQASDENKKLVNDFVWMWKAGKSRIDTPDFHTSAEWHRIEKAIGQGQTKQAQSIQFFWVCHSAQNCSFDCCDSGVFLDNIFGCLPP